MKNQYTIKYSIGFMIINLLICYNLAVSQEVVIKNGVAVNFTKGTLSFSNGTSLSVNSPNCLFGGTVVFAGSKNQNLNSAATVKLTNLVVNNSSLLSLFCNIEVLKELSLSKGVLNLLNNNVLIKKDAKINGNFSNTSMIAADSQGKLIREICGLGIYLFPVGDVTGNPDYSPVNLEFKTGNFTNYSTVSVNVKNTKHPKNTSKSNYLKRYWSIRSAGINCISANAKLVYTPTDIVGNESSIYGALWNNYKWKLLNKAYGNTINTKLSEFNDITGVENGCFDSDKSVAENVDVVISENGISLFPKDFVQIRKIEIYNKVGQMVYSKMLEPNSTLELPLSLNTDIYLVKVITDKNVITKKVFLQ